MELETGTVIADRYVVEGRLGRGGMAVVYRVRHLQRGSRHALKVLSVTSPHIHERLLREGDIQARMGHVNIVSVSEVLSVSGAPALVLELVAGPPLSSLLRHAELTIQEVDALVLGILRGMAAAHGAGVVHRDLKPGNVLVAVEDGRLVPKITDFGLAKALLDDDPSHTRTSATLGTPAYMAPEQIRSARNVDARADVWALGVLLYELFTGELPFAHDDQLELFQAIASGAHVPLRERVPELPERMLATVDAALTVDREERPATASALLQLWGGEEPALSWSTSLLEVAREIAPDSLLSEGETVLPSPAVGAATWTPEPVGPEGASEAAPSGGTPTSRPGWQLPVVLAAAACAVLALGWGLGRWLGPDPVSEVAIEGGLEVTSTPPGEVPRPIQTVAVAPPSDIEIPEVDEDVTAAGWPFAQPVSERWRSEMARTQPLVDRSRDALLHARFDEAHEQADWAAAASGVRRLEALMALCSLARGRQFSAQMKLSERTRPGRAEDGLLWALRPAVRRPALEAWLKDNPDDWLARVWRLQLPVGGDDPDVRDAHLQALVDELGDLPLTWWVATREHLARGRLDEARESVGRGLRLSDNNPWLILQRARLLQATGAVGPALQQVEKLQGTAHAVPEAEVVRADLLLLGGRPDEAAEVVDEVLASHVSKGLHAPLAYGHAPLLVAAGRTDDAIDLLERAVAFPRRVNRHVEVVKLSLMLAELRTDPAERADDLGWARSALEDPALPNDVRAVLAAELRRVEGTEQP